MIAAATADTAPALAAWPILTLTVYCVAVVIASLAGGALPQRLRMTHTGMQHVISLVGGLMLGTALFHLLPHALHDTQQGPGSVDRVMLTVMAGIVLMFGMLRLFHHHHHGEQMAFGGDALIPAPLDASQPPASDSNHGGELPPHDPHPHAQHHDAHDRHADHEHAACVHALAADGIVPGSAAGSSWIGVLVGLTIHTLIDGMALAASVRMDHLHGGAGGVMLGFGTFLAVFLHKPLDAVSITSMMAAGGRSTRLRQLANLAFALACPLGAALCYAGLAGGGGAVVGYLLAFSAGVFLCIALSDLLPEMEFHSHDRFTLTAMLLLGLAAAWLLRFMEGDLHG